MASVASDRVLICADSPATAAEYRDWLAGPDRAVAGMSQSIDCQTFTQAGGDLLNGVVLVIIDGSRGPIEALHLCRRLRSRLVEPHVPILFVTGDAASAGRSSVDQGADTWLCRPFPRDMLLAQVEVLLKLRDLTDRLSDRAAELQQLNRRLQQLYQQRDQERILADQLGASLFPTGFPAVPRTAFGVRSRNGHMGRLGGDFYEVFRLDEHHVGMYLADVMARGVSGTLLSLYLQRTLVTKEIHDGQYRLLPPHEVLERINRVVVEQSFAAQPFGRMIYVLFDHRTGLVRIARGGSPAPWLVPNDGPVVRVPLDGSLIGLGDVTFPLYEQTLKPGDKLLLSSDRVTGLIDATGPAEADVARLLSRHKEQPVQAFVDGVFRELGGIMTVPDNLTLLAFELLAE